MRKLAISSSLLLLTNAVELGFEQVYPDWISATNVSVSYQPNPKYQPCSCDLSANSCDANCCCDYDCSFAIRAQWVQESTCLNVNYNRANGLPLSDCVKKQREVYEFNQKHGLQTYMDTFTKLFCVYLNNAPIMDYYYNQKNEISNEEVDKLTNDIEKQGFVSTIFGSEDRGSTLPYYFEGDKMYSKLTFVNSQYYRGFPLPKPDLNGGCDNFKTPLFMQNSESTCTQVFDLQNECTSVLGVTTSKVYIYNVTNSYYADATATPTDPIMTRNATDNTCSCSGYMKEIHYTIKTTPTAATSTIDRPYFSMETVQATIVISNDPIQVTCGTKAKVQQKYSVKFVTTNTNTIQHKSGNPGYIGGMPMLVGRVDTNSGGILAYQNGFQFKGANQFGQCYNIPTDPTTSTEKFYDYGDPVLKFGQDISYGCSVQLNLAELQAYCSGLATSIVNSQLFKNLEFIQRYGEFGNANIYQPSDWKNVNVDISFQSLGSQISYTDFNKTCYFYPNAHYKIFYAKMGFEDNPQNYIVDIYKYAYPEMWQFTRTSDTQKQTFSHEVSVQYIEISKVNSTNSTYVSPPSNKVPKDFFYPFYIRSTASYIQVGIQTIISSAILVIISQLL
eukprot:403359727